VVRLILLLCVYVFVFVHTYVWGMCVYVCRRAWMAAGQARTYASNKQTNHTAPTNQSTNQPTNQPTPTDTTTPCRFHRPQQPPPATTAATTTAAGTQQPQAEPATSPLPASGAPFDPSNRGIRPIYPAWATQGGGGEKQLAARLRGVAMLMAYRWVGGWVGGWVDGVRTCRVLY
jgi:hypothetical protein